MSVGPVSGGQDYGAYWDDQEGVCELPPDAAQSSEATDDAQQTSTRTSPAPHADAGVSDSGDSVYAEAAAISGRDSQSGIEVDAFGVRGEVGAQNEASVVMARVGASSDDGTDRIAMDVFSGRANIGIHNADGSTGANAGAMATAVGVEGTVGHSGNSVTGGLSLSAGAEGSVGIRDQDGDGSKEVCARVSLMFFTVGGCVENPF
ncbi:hypothetical protein ACFL59_03555 [Planctomycetota bacterium]